MLNHDGDEGDDVILGSCVHGRPLVALFFPSPSSFSILLFLFFGLGAVW